MIPHERSLVEKWKGRPFALLGVNSDRTNTEKGMATYKEKNKGDLSVTWRSFRNEANDPTISAEWRVRAWPTLYYIDHNGVIQHKNIRDETEMEEVLEDMIVAAEEAAKKK